MRSPDAALRAPHFTGAPDSAPLEACTLETARWASGCGKVCYEVHLPLHRRVSVSQVTTLHWSLPQALDGFRRGGVPAIGLWLRRMLERGLEHSIDEVRQSGLLVSSVGWVGGFTGGRSGSWEQAVQTARLAVWTAAQVGAPAVTVITGPERTHIRKHALRLVLQALRTLAPFAAEHRVKLALQPLHPVCNREWTFLHSLGATLDVLDQVNHPWVGLAYNPFHLCHEPALLARIPQLIDRIACVQLTDWAGAPVDANDRPLAGDGRLPLGDHVRALESAGYRGLYELDAWSRDLWQRSPQGLIAECRRRFERLCTPATLVVPSLGGSARPALH
jgi:sugar phosphate isomerase/epimerase